MKYENNGFTLAEVLITLVIIGVIAAMTVPTLMNNLKHRELVNQLKNTYADLSQAMTSILGENGGSIAGLCTDDDCLMTLYKNKMNIVKECTSSDTIAGVCWHDDSNVRTLSGGTMSWGAYPTFITSRGDFIRIRNSSESCDAALNVSGSYQLNSNVGCGFIAIDVNGFKKPNVIGRDIFYFSILKDRLIPWGSTSIDNFACSGIGYGCAGKVLVEDDMDY